ncbi:sigma-70 family RNA polymerase sigma factor [Streptomyces sp. N35]|uniref:RNA polymerase sigma factor n=1 Tax=Streptomyces sp. N35 TaxID=2795730 RepID=UPI0027DD63B0|nr:sigma-70 family RNA polymerase sigma factor [Streptomyces sp. N35]
MADARDAADAQPTPWDTALPLVRAAQRGDALAMDDLLTRVTPYVTRLCRPIAPADTADAVQEALTAVFKGLRGLRDPQAFYGWVRMVTIREAVRVARRTAVERPAEPDELARLGGLSADVDTELSADVRDVLSRLPVHYRAVLVLRELEGLDERSAARLLGLAPGTVKSRLHRARSLFRRSWSEPTRQGERHEH